MLFDLPLFLLAVLAAEDRRRWIRLVDVAVGDLTQIINTFIKVKKRLILVIYSLQMLLLVPLLHLANLLLPAMDFLNLWHISIWILLYLHHVHSFQGLHRVNDSTITLTLLKALIQQINL